MVANLFAALPAPLPDEVTETLVRAKQLRIERIISHEHCSPPDFWYDQDEHEFVLLVQGAARLRFETEVLELNPGDWLQIPAHRRHRVDWTTPAGPTIWLAVFYRDEA